jgi:predicted ATP-dependent serine protease
MPQLLLGVEGSIPEPAQQEQQQEQKKKPSHSELHDFSERVLEEDGIWEHAFDESNDIEIPQYLDNPIKTGLGYMDYILGEAGFYPTQCTVLTGDPGCGKTTMALEMASAMRGLGTTVAFASCEMRKGSRQTFCSHR